MADFAEHLFFGNLHVLERHGARVARLDSHLLFDFAERDSRRLGIDDERSHALLELSLDLHRHFGKHGENARVAGIRDPDFLAVQHVVRPILTRHGAAVHRLRVGAGTGFGEAKGGDEFARSALGEPTLLLLFRTEERDSLAANRLVRAEVDRQRGVRFTNRAKHPVEHHRRGAESAVFLGNIEPHHPEFVHAVAHGVGELAVVVELVRVDRVPRPGAKRVEHSGEVLSLLGAQLGKWKDEVFTDFAEEDGFRETGIMVGIGEVYGHPEI